MKIRYIGDGKKFIHGYPARRDKTLDVSDEVGEKLIKSGLYEEVKTKLEEETEDINKTSKTKKTKKPKVVKEKTEDVVNETNQFGQGVE